MFSGRKIGMGMGDLLEMEKGAFVKNGDNMELPRRHAGRMGRNNSFSDKAIKNLPCGLKSVILAFMIRREIMCQTPKKPSLSPEEHQKLIQAVEKHAPVRVTKEQRETITAVYAQHRQLFKVLSK